MTAPDILPRKRRPWQVISAIDIPLIVVFLLFCLLNLPGGKDAPYLIVIPQGIAAIGVGYYLLRALLPPRVWVNQFLGGVVLAIILPCFMLHPFAAHFARWGHTPSQIATYVLLSNLVIWIALLVASIKQTEEVEAAARHRARFELRHGPKADFYDGEGKHGFPGPLGLPVRTFFVSLVVAPIFLVLCLCLETIGASEKLSQVNIVAFKWHRSSIGPWFLYFSFFVVAFLAANIAMFRAKMFRTIEKITGKPLYYSTEAVVGAREFFGPSFPWFGDRKR